MKTRKKSTVKNVKTSFSILKLTDLIQIKGGGEPTLKDSDFD